MPKPIPGAIVTCPYGRPGRYWAAGKHTGRDYRARTPVPVYATAPGRVIHAGWGGWGPSYGLHVIIETDGIRHLYAHLSGLSVRAGRRVSTGTRIGTSGSTGNAPAPHLHYEERVAPYRYMNYRAPQFDLQGPPKPPVDLALLQAALRRAKHGKVTKVPNGRLVKKALVRELGKRFRLLTISNYIGPGTAKAYAALQSKWYPTESADGVAGRTSLTRLGLRGGFRVR